MQIRVVEQRTGRTGWLDDRYDTPGKGYGSVYWDGEYGHRWSPLWDVKKAEEGERHAD